MSSMFSSACLMTASTTACFPLHMAMPLPSTGTTATLQKSPSLTMRSPLRSKMLRTSSSVLSRVENLMLYS